MVPMATDRTTLEVRKQTKDRVNAVKGPLTADDLINLALDHLPAKEVEALYANWEKQALAALRKDPRLKGRFHPPPQK